MPTRVSSKYIITCKHADWVNRAVTAVWRTIVQQPSVYFYLCCLFGLEIWPVSELSKKNTYDAEKQIKILPHSCEEDSHANIVGFKRFLFRIAEFRRRTQFRSIIQHVGRRVSAASAADNRYKWDGNVVVDTVCRQLRWDGHTASEWDSNVLPSSTPTHRRRRQHSRAIQRWLAASSYNIIILHVSHQSFD